MTGSPAPALLAVYKLENLHKKVSFNADLKASPSYVDKGNQEHAPTWHHEEYEANGKSTGSKHVVDEVSNCKDPGISTHC